jgi:hypothetical protein
MNTKRTPSSAGWFIKQFLLLNVIWVNNNEIGKNKKDRLNS